MRRFRIPDAAVGSTLALPPGEARHASRVLRLKPGDRVALFDGRGAEWVGQITRADKGVEVLVLEARPPASPAGVTIASACPKGKRLDWLVQKIAELGVTRFLPVRFRRSVVPMTGPRRARLERVAAEASKQCRRSDVLEIADEIEPADLAPTLEAGTLFLAAPDARETLVRVARLPATIIIGPEGGCTKVEETALTELGAKPVSLGRTVLRVETAAVAAAAVFAQLEQNA